VCDSLNDLSRVVMKVWNEREESNRHFLVASPTPYAAIIITPSCHTEVLEVKLIPVHS